ncbi:hypothetical protein Ga0609869_001877 [Rhodovulum iodosum]|uniref:Uncharacterized protein n=1 Tax=Rhodovulum iodosum TaxID=68291 RepID=A0ABV3XTW2_9RHOB|nr:hypothetical protein [Rhodovulum robiginosum]RSK31995.1 hypothetical protein EJA01_12160 [Rhodovulum robiginosum]
MMIARWHIQTRFGHKQAAIDLIQEWKTEIRAQTELDMSAARLVTGSVGAAEAEIEEDIPIASLADLDVFFEKIGSVKLHADWRKKMSGYVVSGSSYWEVFRVIG